MRYVDIMTSLHEIGEKTMPAFQVMGYIKGTASQERRWARQGTNTGHSKYEEELES